MEGKRREEEGCAMHVFLRNYSSEGSWECCATLLLLSQVACLVKRDLEEGWGGNIKVEFSHVYHNSAFHGLV